MLMFNHEKLEERINVIYGSKEAFGEVMGMTKQRINSKLNGASEFTMVEIEKASELLNILPGEAASYFFDVVKIDHGKYEVKVDKLLLTTSDSGEPMMSICFKVTSDQHMGSLIFMNQVITKGFQIHIANEFLRSLDSGFDIEFTTYKQYGGLLWDLYDAIKSKEYLIDYKGSIQKTKVQVIL